MLSEMSSNRIAWPTFIVLAVFASIAYAGNSKLEVAESELKANWNNLKSISAKLHVQAVMNNKYGRISSEGEGRFALDRITGKDRFYKQLKTVVTTNFNDKPLLTDSAGIAVTIDGITQSMSDSIDNKYIIRKKATYSDRRDAPIVLDFLHQAGMVTLLESKMLDSRITHVIESKYTTPGSLVSRIVVHFDLQTGVAVRITTYDINNAFVNMSTLTITAENTKLLESIFDLPHSEGAILIDETKK